MQLRYDRCKYKRQWRCTVEFRFLAERGSHRLKASLSSNEMSNFPPELFVPNLFGVRFSKGALDSDTRQRVVRNVVRVKQMRVRVDWFGKLGGTADFIRPLHGNMQGTFCVQAKWAWKKFWKLASENFWLCERAHDRVTKSRGCTRSGGPWFCTDRNAEETGECEALRERKEI